MARVLIVDDSPTVVTMLRKILEGKGHEVLELDLMTRLPKVLSESPPDLIILDLEMPTLDGKVVGRLVRRFEESPIPIVIFSSRGVADLQEAASEVEADDWVPKTAPMGDFLQVVDRALARARESAEPVAC